MINTDSPVGLVHPTPDPDLKTALSLELLEIANLKVAKMQKKPIVFVFPIFPFRRQYCLVTRRRRKVRSTAILMMN